MEVTKTEEIKAPGRPTNPSSKRQQRINDLAARKAAGELKLGRPAVPNSKRAIAEEAKAARIAAGETIRRGRPVFTAEQKAAAAAAKAPLVINVTPVIAVTEEDLMPHVADNISSDIAVTEEVIVTLAIDEIVVAEVAPKATKKSRKTVTAPTE